MTPFVATLAAALFGTADFLGGLASRRTPALLVTVVSQAAGFLLLGAVALTWPPSSWVDPTILWGASAGIWGGLGVVALYAGLGTGRMSIVAPIAAALSGSIPAAFGMVVRQESLSWTAVLGVVLAFVAVLIVSSTAEDDGTGNTGRAVVLAVAAGVGFAGSILSYAQTPTDTGFAPLALARITTVTMLAIVLLAGGRFTRLQRSDVGAMALVGLTDACANVAQVVAIRMGPIAVASVLGGLYPVGTLLLARFVLHERLQGWQRVGIALALVAVVLTAL